MNKNLILFLLAFCFFFGTSSSVEARSGCCSSHGGVNSCQCGDGSTLSDTCRPYYPECNSAAPVANTAPLVVTLAPTATDPSHSHKAQQLVNTSVEIQHNDEHSKENASEPTQHSAHEVPTKSAQKKGIPSVATSQMQHSSTIKFSLNKNNHLYEVSADWNDISNSTGYSVEISEIKGKDPGPTSDTKDSKWTFKNVSSGTKFINIKAKMGERWSKIFSVKVELPTPKISFTNKGLLEHTTKISPIKRLEPTSVPAPTKAPVADMSGFTCNCATTCSQMTSCAEAKFQLRQCGCAARDGDHDGIPCENVCR